MKLAVRILKPRNPDANHGDHCSRPVRGCRCWRSSSDFPDPAKMLQAARMSCRCATLCAPAILCLLGFLPCTRPAAHGKVAPTGSRLFRRLAIGERGHGSERLAGCQPVTQQIANLRHNPTGSWEASTIAESHIGTMNHPLTRPSGTLSPSEGERAGVRGEVPEEISSREQENRVRRQSR